MAATTVNILRGCVHILHSISFRGLYVFYNVNFKGLYKILHYVNFKGLCVFMLGLSLLSFFHQGLIKPPKAQRGQLCTHSLKTLLALGLTWASPSHRPMADTALQCTSPTWQVGPWVVGQSQGGTQLHPEQHPDVHYSLTNHWSKSKKKKLWE